MQCQPPSRIWHLNPDRTLFNEIRGIGERLSWTRGGVWPTHAIAYAHCALTARRARIHFRLVSWTVRRRADTPHCIALNGLRESGLLRAISQLHNHPIAQSLVSTRVLFFHRCSDAWRDSDSSLADTEGKWDMRSCYCVKREARLSIASGGWLAEFGS